MNGRAAFGVALVVVLVAACTRYGTLDRSQGFTGKPASATVDDIPVKGFEVDIDYGTESIQGELLAIDRTYLYVLADTRARAIPRSKVRTVSIELYPSYSGAAGAWTALGTVSTISHGFWLVFSAPVWLGVGVPMSVSAGLTNDLDVGSDQLGPLYQYARFPQGLPPSWPRAASPANDGGDAGAPEADARAWDASPE